MKSKVQKVDLSLVKLQAAEQQLIKTEALLQSTLEVIEDTKQMIVGYARALVSKGKTVRDLTNIKRMLRRQSYYLVSLESKAEAMRLEIGGLFSTVAVLMKKRINFAKH